MFRASRSLGRWLIVALVLSALLVPSLAGPKPARAGDPCTLLAREPLPFPGPGSVTAVPPALARPELASSVELVGSGFDYRYLVNGRPEVIHGMGYNPRYYGLDATERRALYERDFSMMAAAGVNTVFGWNPAEFDGLVLDVAADHGLGVALPYDFDYNLDYGDSAVRQAVSAEVLDWVARYRWHPALRIWAIGNETLHKLVPPAWCADPPTPGQRGAALAFADFYAELIDRVHALDPRHPVVYRAAEDSYVEWLRAALAPGGHRPWFVYGLNVYTARLPSVIESWPAQRLDAAVLLSEFAPPPEERPEGFRHYWAAIRARPEMVLGGSVYVWFAEGPEEVDRVYGLVGPDGQPVDGALDTVRRIFRTEAQSERWWEEGRAGG